MSAAVDLARLGKPPWTCPVCLNNAETCRACSSTGCRPGTPQHRAAVASRNRVACEACGHLVAPWDRYRDRRGRECCLECATRADREADR
jgi:hypothetical protein